MAASTATRCWKRAIDAILALEPKPDLALLTGDMVDRGSIEEYARLKPLLDRLDIPLAIIPGNHDARDTLHAAFGKTAIMGKGEFLHWVRDDLGALRIIGLDTHVPGKVNGELCERRLAWLEATLATAPDRPTLIATHHPPFTTAIDPRRSVALRGRGGVREDRREEQTDRAHRVGPSASPDDRAVRRHDRQRVPVDRASIRAGLAKESARDVDRRSARLPAASLGRREAHHLDPCRRAIRSRGPLKRKGRGRPSPSRPFFLRGCGTYSPGAGPTGPVSSTVTASGPLRAVTTFMRTG